MKAKEETAGSDVCYVLLCLAKQQKLCFCHRVHNAMSEVFVQTNLKLLHLKIVL